MTKRMLIDASHAEETRVVVLDGSRLEDFDVETSTKRQLKGNIYLAKVVRVEPSLQAAFVEYGGNRHGFLAFSEIHPDYYQIPIADRQRLLDMEEEEARREEEEEEEAAVAHHAARATTPERRELAREPEPAPEPFALEATDESGAVIAIDPPGQPDQQDEANENAPAEPEPAAAETTDESGATIAIEGPEQTEAQAPSGENAPSDPPPAAEPEPPAAETTDESGATLAIEPPAADEDPEETPAKPPRAQPMAIESERLSGPVEPAEPSSDLSPQPEAQSALQAEEPPMAETGDESGATVELLSEARHEQPEPAEHPDEPDEDDEPFGYDQPMEESRPPETVGGEQDGDDRGERRMPSRFLRNYKIQEVIKRRQIMLVQVVKEERGTKGAALTTYVSLAGRFSVLMPNSPRGGGISRKITSATDRRRLKEVIGELDLPKGMGLIVRTAGANRPKPEIKRDCEYLLRLWDDIREHTLKSVAPALIYEEASLIKRAIRDVYSRDIDEIAVDGEDGWRSAHEFMRMLMPSHAKKVQLWRDGGQPLFARYQVEAQLDNMLLPTVQLRSGGYLVINQTEALVAIDVNSGRSTRERNVEETALRTNLEAADEAARQLRLRDLAGLIVIDFIDMESRKHNGMVEKRLKEALKNDRARIQVGHISHFGLLEMSRQRLRPSLAETSFIPCPHCGGTGHVRSTESAALHVLRGIEEEGSKRRAAEIVVHVPTSIALYILNHKRDRLLEIERRYAMRVTLSGDDRQIEPQFRIDRLRPQTAPALPAAVTPDFVQPALPPPLPEPVEEEDEAPAAEEAAEAEDAADAGEEETRAEAGETGELSAEEAERRRRRRRRRRRGRREDGPAPGHAEAETHAEAEAPAEPGLGAAPEAVPEPPEAEHIEGVPEHAEAASSDDDRNRRRGRRGGRRRRREPGEAGETPLASDAEQPDQPPVYTGPTPANPFGGHAFDIFDMLEQAEGYMAPHAPPTPAEVTIIPGPPPATAMMEEPAEQLAIMNTAAPEPAPEEPVAAEPAPPPEAPAMPPAEAVVPAEMPPTEASAPAEMPAAEPVAAPAAAAVETLASPAEVAEEPSAEPAIKPILVGSPEEPAAEKKRGWWRR